MEAYFKNLNDKQRQAVEAIEGPVLVIAGAGTGKTHTIAARIANILTKTDINPENILCLTFTDNAVTNMRERLKEVIGVTSYKVRLHTFHSFSNEVIRANLDKFIFAKDINLLSDGERLEIILSLIDQLDDGAALKPWGDHYYYRSQIESLIQSLKREDVSPEKLLDLIRDEKEFIEKTGDLFLKLKESRKEVLDIFAKIYEISLAYPPLAEFLNYQKIFFDQGGYDKGLAKNPLINFKNALWKTFTSWRQNIDKQLNLQQIYAEYQVELKRRGRYDYDDMILMVLNKFKQDVDLLADYQEQYQYILVDEYQDTNTAQNELLFLLASYDNQPNLFVVGDDDQSIFRFQGANLENIYDFVNRFHPQVITLNNNYRSQQMILDSSRYVIEKSVNRITKILSGIDKSLIAMVNDQPHPINLLAAASDYEENYFVANKIKTLIKDGISPNEIAVLYHDNADVTGLLPWLDNLGIKYRLSSGNNILNDLIINQFISLLKYIDDPSRDDQLALILNFDFLKIDPLALVNYFRFKKTTDKKITRIIHLLGKAHQWRSNLSPEKFFHRVIRRFGLLKSVIQEKDYLTLLKFNRFYEEFRRFVNERQGSLTDFLHYLDLLKDNKVALDIGDTLPDDNSINLMTVHKAKGLEFDQVFLIHLTDRRWGGGYERSKIKLPYGIIKYEVVRPFNSINEDDRRLFYVALTRAKRDLYLSYTKENPTAFIAEIKPELINNIKPEVSFNQEALLSFFQEHKPIIREKSFENYLRNYLKTTYQLSPTHLNSYLNCPLCFYYRTILRVPLAKSRLASYGSAVHYALTDLYRNSLSLEKFLEIFENFLRKENLNSADFKENLAKGIKELSEYYHHYQDSFQGKFLLEYDFKKLNVYLDNVPITGRIDKLELNGREAVAVDFKTGSFKNNRHKEDYQRQILFYKLLGDHCPQFPYQIKSGVLDYIGECRRQPVAINPESLEKLVDLIKEVYCKILKLEFNQIGQDCEDKDHFHQFQKV